MGGYITFKKNKFGPKEKNVAIENFRRLLKKYYADFRNNQTDTLAAHFVYSDDYIEIDLMPVNIFHKIKVEKYKNEQDIIIFEMILQGELTGMIRLYYNIKLSHKNMVDFIYEKIEKK